jgi:Tol biopolymer transport system component
VSSYLALVGVSALAAPWSGVAAESEPSGPPGQGAGDPTPALLEELKSCPFKIVFETIRDGNWELYVMNADGTHPENITRTADIDELYPKASPDGTRIAFVADEGKGAERVRNLYWMRRDGSGRTLVARNAREPCFSADGTAIAYLGGEMASFNYNDFATKGIFIHSLESGTTRRHPNESILHLYTLNWSPDGKWFVATVHGGMGFSHAILALEAGGNGVYDLHLGGCRPDLSPDAKRIAWGHGDFAIGVADLDLSASPPRATNVRNAVLSAEPLETYHADWSPDGKYICYTFGPKKKQKDLKGLIPELPGSTAPGWNLCVCDAAGQNRWVALTSDGQSDKEPDWIPVAKEVSGR